MRSECLGSSEMPSRSKSHRHQGGSPTRAANRRLDCGWSCMASASAHKNSQTLYASNIHKISGTCHIHLHTSYTKIQSKHSYLLCGLKPNSTSTCRGNIIIVLHVNHGHCCFMFNIKLPDWAKPLFWTRLLCHFCAWEEGQFLQNDSKATTSVYGSKPQDLFTL